MPSLPRGFAGKTFVLAVLAATEAVALGASVSLLAASEEQGRIGLDYLTRIWERTPTAGGSHKRVRSAGISAPKMAVTSTYTRAQRDLHAANTDRACASTRPTSSGWRATTASASPYSTTLLDNE